MLLRHILAHAARRAAANPRLRAKAAELYQSKGKPILQRKAAQIREIAQETDPREQPAYFAGRVLRRLIDG